MSQPGSEIETKLWGYETETRSKLRKPCLETFHCLKICLKVSTCDNNNWLLNVKAKTITTNIITKINLIRLYSCSQIIS